MGFLSKVKGTAKQAANPGGQMKERDKITKINAAGVDATATVDWMAEVGSQIGGGHQIEFELTVHPADGEGDYKVTTSQSMHEQTLKGVEQGARIQVKIDPDDPHSLAGLGSGGLGRRVRRVRLLRFKALSGSSFSLLLAAVVLGACLALAVPAAGAGSASIVTKTTEPGMVELEENPAISADGSTIAFVRDYLGSALFLKRLGHPATAVDVPPGEESETEESEEGFEAGSPSLSADGRLLAFASEDPELSSEDVNYDRSAAGTFLVRHIFVYDARTGKTQLVSRNTGPRGSAAARDSNLPSISADGRYVAFTSEGPNMRPRVIGGVYVRDLERLTTVLGSRDSGRRGKPTEGFHPSLSANGALLAYLVPSRPRGRLEVAVRNLRSGRTTVVSRADGPHGALADGDCFETEISANGRFVAYASKATNLAPHRTDGHRNVYVTDLRSGRTVLVSRGNGVGGAVGNDDSTGPSISADGRRVAFETQATNLGVSGDHRNTDVIVRNLRDERDSFITSGFRGSATHPALAGDARSVIFNSLESNGVPGAGPNDFALFRVALGP